MTELPKTFDPAAIEQRWYEHWESKGLFRPDRADAERYELDGPERSGQAGAAVWIGVARELVQRLDREELGHAGLPR